MRVIFADTVYWVALINPREALHRSASEIGDRLGKHRIVTSEMVLVEVLNMLAEFGAHFRAAAARLADEIAGNQAIELVPQSPELFRHALALYRDRADKSWSLTDCASFVIMDERRITEALTQDQHFEQSGFRALLRG